MTSIFKRLLKLRGNSVVEQGLRIRGVVEMVEGEGCDITTTYTAINFFEEFLKKIDIAKLNGLWESLDEEQYKSWPLAEILRKEVAKELTRRMQVKATSSEHSCTAAKKNRYH